MKVEKWNYWVLNSFSGKKPPIEWVNILKEIKEIKTKYINKIEVAGFSIRGERIARWQLTKEHPEYSTLENALGAAKKLTWLLLKSMNAPTMSDELKFLLNSKKDFLEEFTCCPLCKNKIKYEDFELDGRKDLNSIQMGHLIPLSKIKEGHNKENVMWMHRRCNYIQDEQTLDETIIFLKQILNSHGFVVSE